MYRAIVSKNTTLTSADGLGETVQADSTELRIEQIYKVINDDHIELMNKAFPESDYGHIPTKNSDPAYRAYRDKNGNITITKDTTPTHNDKINTLISNFSTLDSETKTNIHDMFSNILGMNTTISTFENQINGDISTFENQINTDILTFKTQTNVTISELKNDVSSYQQDLDREKLKTTNLQERILVMEQAYYAMLERVSDLENS